MYCYVYKGDLKEDYYLYLDKELSLSTTPEDAVDLADVAAQNNIPEAVLTLMGQLSLVVEFELDLERKLPQAEAAQVMQDISQQGFYLQMPKKDMHAIEDSYFN